MKQIRNNVFETNSSSTHSICISKAPVKHGDFVYFGFGEYGWEDDCVTDTASYLYTAICSGNDREGAEEKIKELKDILDSYGIKYEFEDPEWVDGSYCNKGYIDHSYDTHEFVDAALNSPDLLMRYLFGDSCIYTGNDNSCDYDNMCYAAIDRVWDDDTGCEIPNSNHDEDRYDYFFKSN